MPLELVLLQGEPLDGWWLLVAGSAILLVAAMRGIVRLWLERQRLHDPPMLVFPARAASAEPRPGLPSPRSMAPLHPVAPPPPPPPPPAPDPAAETVRFDPSLEGTVQLVPGRLEILSGPEAGRALHFVRGAGAAIPDLTLGRAAGRPDRHLRLQGPTISRVHARLRYEGRRWRIVNLSETNPLRVNGRELPLEGEMVVLSEGDLLQVGEVELRFREGLS